MNRAELKHRARQSMSWAKPGPMLFTFVYMLLPLVLSGITSVGSIYQMLSGYSAVRSAQSTIITVVVALLYSVIQAGYTKYCLDVSRNRPVGWSTLFEFINQPFRFIGLTLLVGLVGGALGVVIGLASVLTMFVPFIGIVIIIAASVAIVYVMMGFSLVYYVAVDEPDMGLVDCMKHSWSLMSGRRWEYFVLQLSFILWSFACILVIPTFWVTPYMSITLANYYSLISGRLPLENHPPQQDQPWPGFEEYPPADSDVPPPESEDFEPR